ncbi:UbiH/UbiF/VisC/COQ6 family ubiquinone biosynthesis hydroxylase [Marinobacteraceae bacterium S3BR75-40.1]
MATAPVHDTDIAIVGGGLVGMALALALSSLPVQVRVLEGQSRDSMLAEPPELNGVDDAEPRVSALTEATRGFLADLGAWPRIRESRRCAYRHMRVWDAEGTGAIGFDADTLQVPQLGHIVENRLVVKALVEAALQQDNIELMDRVKVEGWSREGTAQVLRLADGGSVRASLVIGADGAQSRIRRWCGLPTREWDYGQQAIVGTVRTEKPHAMTAWQRFTPTGPLAFLPLATEAGDQHYCSIVWSQDLDAAGRFMQLEDEDFKQMLGEAFEFRLGRIEAVSRRHAFPLRQRHAKHYSMQGVALVGDAAHTIHPLAGQGVNLGFADAAVLADEIRRAVGRGQQPGEAAILRRYERRRKGDNLMMMAGMEGFKQLFGRDELPLRWLRNAGLRWVNGQDTVKSWLATEAMGLHHALPRF